MSISYMCTGLFDMIDIPFHVVTTLTFFKNFSDFLRVEKRLVIKDDKPFRLSDQDRNAL